MAKLHLQLVTPGRVVLNEELDNVSCPTSQGQITVLPGHTPLVAILASGELVARSGTSEHNIHVAGGFVEVKADSRVIILADAAEHAEELDETRAQQAKERAEELLKRSTVSDEEYATAAASLERNLSRLRLIRKYKSHGHGSVTSQGVLKD